MEPIITKHSGNWTSGHIGPFRFEVKHYEEPSVFGIDEGRISKLWLGWKDSYGTVAAFDRGWDKLPGFEEHRMPSTHSARSGIERRNTP